MTPSLDGARATRFSAFAPEPFAEHLDVVWLGMPDDAHDAPGRIVVPVSTLPDHRNAILDAMVGHYGGDPVQHARALMSQWSKYYFGRAAPAGVV
ncbi:TPA: siderophore-iron reductase FhuF, partial [Burkholderia lata]